MLYISIRMAEVPVSCLVVFLFMMYINRLQLILAGGNDVKQVSILILLSCRGSFPAQITSVRKKPIHIEVSIHQMNLCTCPGSCGHSKPLYRKTYPVTALIATNHKNSATSGVNLASRKEGYFSSSSPSLVSLLPLPSDERAGNNTEDGGMCNRHITQGMMKYLGSTKGAVISESEVDKSQTRTKLTRVSCSLGGSDTCDAETEPNSSRDIAGLFSARREGRLRAGPRCAVDEPKAERVNHPQTKYIGITAYLIAGCRRRIRNT